MPRGIAVWAMSDTSSRSNTPVSGCPYDGICPTVCRLLENISISYITDLMWLRRPGCPWLSGFCPTVCRLLENISISFITDLMWLLGPSCPWLSGPCLIRRREVLVGQLFQFSSLPNGRTTSAAATLCPLLQSFSLPNLAPPTH